MAQTCCVFTAPWFLFDFDLICHSQKYNRGPCEDSCTTSLRVKQQVVVTSLTGSIY